MTTPLIIMSLLMVPAFIAALVGFYRDQPALYIVGGQIGLVFAFAFFSVGHFAMTDAMVDMLPGFVPARKYLVYATGFLEAGLAIGLLVPGSRQLAALGCLSVLVLFFPVNVYAAINEVGPGGHQWGPEYLLLRAPLQIVLISWTYWFFLKPKDRVLNLGFET